MMKTELAMKDIRYTNYLSYIVITATALSSVIDDLEASVEVTETRSRR